MTSQPQRIGRPRVESDIRSLIRRISAENPLWRAPRVHGEPLKLGYDVAEATVARHSAKRTPSPIQSWPTFLRNRLTEIVAIDVFTVPTATFETLYVFLVLSLDRRRIIHFNVTDSLIAEWTSRSLVQAFPFDTAPRYCLRDRDSIYGEKVVETLTILGLEQKIIAYQAPWQNGYCARVTGSSGRECLDHVIVFRERHRRRILRAYVAYYDEARTHLGLGMARNRLAEIPSSSMTTDRIICLGLRETGRSAASAGVRIPPFTNVDGLGKWYNHGRQVKGVGTQLAREMKSCRCFPGEILGRSS